MKRKLIIGAAALLVAVLLFTGYILLTGTKGIPVSSASDITDIPDRPLTGQPDFTDKPIIHGAQKAVYPIIDPVTKQVRRVFGFDSLLNPGRQSNTWQVRRPYMNVFEKRFRCRMDAEEGSIQVEYSGSSVIPKDARLLGKVVIRLFPEQRDRFSETVILLDDLNYSSERSEFFTDGPVQLVSAQARLVGKGMQMIYNPQNERIEYFRIKDVEYLRLKKVVGFGFTDKLNAPQDGAAESAAGQVSPPQETGREDTADRESSGDQDNLFYQCSILKDVEIHYGKELIVQGTDQVNILNFLLNSSSAPSSVDTSSVAQAEPSAAAPQTTAAAFNDINWDDRQRLPRTPEDDDSTDVIVMCKGGIIVQPVGGMFKPDDVVSLDVRMTGSPMRVFRQNPQQKDQTLPLIQCQSLLYSPSVDVLKLFAGELGKTVRVFIDSDKNYLETVGNLVWDVRSRYAQVDGPGRIVFDFAGQNESASSEKSGSGAEVSFGRKMDVFFAKTKDVSNGQLTLSAMDLIGGMNAVMEQSGFKTEAQSARFEFGQSNQLAQAKLSGMVRFASDSTSQAAADEALLTFDPDNTLKVADLKGNVAFASAQGQFTSNDAKIQFAKNQDGRLEPLSLTSTTGASLISAVSDPTHPPARFEAKKMDYDLLKGSAFALGPIRFSFYIPADANDPASFVPVVITAQRNAEFLTGPDRKIIQKAIFRGNVVGESVKEKNNEKNEQRFFGDTLTVDLTPDAKGRTTVKHVAVTDGDVKLQAIRYLDGVKINHVELLPVRFDYEDALQTITALGPGKIELNNQQIPVDAQVVSEQKMFDFRQPCYALIEGFDKLVWRMNEQKITADGRKDSLNLSYLTMKDNVPDQLTRVAVSTAQLLFAKDENNKDFLSELTAAGGVYLEQKDKHVLKGQTMHYTGSDGWIHIEGSENQPCFADGNPFPVIDYNFRTDEFRTELSQNPGAVIRPR